jgi:ABC-type transport system involved in multi-copper enzyme maturation permease subunit
MIWFTWRQQRWQLICGAVLLVAGLVALPLIHAGIADYISAGNRADCVQPGATACGGSTSGFPYYDTLKNLEYAFLALPLVIGVFWAAPSLARELESGTYMLALTQSVGRKRWLFTKLAVGLLPALVLVGVLQLLLAWCVAAAGRFGPLTEGAFKFVNYGSVGVVSLAYTIFMFGLGMLVGLLAKRTVTAMALTMAGFLVVRLTLESVRASFLPPRTALSAFGATGNAGPQGSLDLFLESGLVKTDGEHVASTFNACYNVEDSAKCLQQAGFTGTYTNYLSGSLDYWPLQLIESGLLVVLAVACVLAAGYLIKRNVR